MWDKEAAFWWRQTWQAEVSTYHRQPMYIILIFQGLQLTTSTMLGERDGCHSPMTGLTSLITHEERFVLQKFENELMFECEELLLESFAPWESYFIILGSGCWGKQSRWVWICALDCLEIESGKIVEQKYVSLRSDILMGNENYRKGYWFEI